MKNTLRFGLVIALLVVLGCAGYEYKPVPFKAAESYPNRVTLAGAIIAARAWFDQSEAWQTFGFDIIGAGLTPIQLIVDNKGSQALQVIVEQTLLQDSQDNLWNVLPGQVAYERIEKNVRLQRAGGEGSRQAGLGAAAGAILGGAFAVITGQNIAEAAGKGAVAGAAIGSVKGGSEGYGDPGSQRRIRDDLRDRRVEDKPFQPNQISHGFLFFPGEVKKPKLLRLKLRELGTGREHLLEFALGPSTKD